MPFAVGWVTRQPAWHGWSSTWICPASKCPGSAMLFVTAFKCRRFTCPIWDADARGLPRSRNSSRRGLCSRSIWPEVGAPRTRIRPALESVWVKPSPFFISFLFPFYLFIFFFFFFLCHSQLLLQSWTPRRSQNSKNSGNAYTVGVSFLSLLISDGSVCTSFGKLKGSTKLGIIKKKKKKEKIEIDVEPKFTRDINTVSSI